MLYPFDHGTITKVQPRAPRPFLLSGLSLYMYTPLLSSRVSKRVNYLSLFRLLIKEGYVLATQTGKLQSLSFSKFIDESKEGGMSRSKVRKSTRLVLALGWFTHLIHHCVTSQRLNLNTHRLNELGQEDDKHFLTRSKIILK